MLTVKNYINEVFCSIKQTDLVFALLDNENIFKKLYKFNLFHSFNNEDGKVFKNVEEKDVSDSILEEKITRERKNYKDILSEITNASTVYKINFHSKLTSSASKIEILEKELAIERNKIIQFRNSVDWIAIKYEPFANELINLGLPVISYANNFWWGYVKSNDLPVQREVVNFAEKLKINPLDSISENFELIKYAFINQNLLEREVAISNPGSHQTYEEAMINLRHHFNNIQGTIIKNPIKFKNDFK